MPLVVRLQDESGTVVSVNDPNGTCDGAGDFDRLMPEGDESFLCLGVVDLYGDTIFNRLQMPGLLEDIGRLEAMDCKPPEARGLRRLRALAEACRDDVHLYVRFIGD